jgi:hypothetical protein
MFLRQLATLLFLFYAGTVMAYEEPKYDVIEKSDVFELRAYKPFIVAEAFVDGSMDEASNKGFRLIAHIW